MNTTSSTRGGWAKAAAVSALSILGGAALVGAASRMSEPALAQSKSGPLAPELVGDSWLNTPGNRPISLASRRGQVSIVEFWTFGCSNCQANLPAYARWNKQFAASGVQVIGVHTPETSEERSPANVARRVKELGITYPVLIDGQSENWQRWGQRYWPTVYVLDKAGRVRFKWEGELNSGGAGGEKKVAGLVQNLLREPAPATQRADARDAQDAQVDEASIQLVSDDKAPKREARDKGVGHVVKSDAEWKKILTPAQYDVLRQQGTEPPFSGDFHPKKVAGVWRCAGCGLELFRASTMFDSGTGWPSFWQPIAGHVMGRKDADGDRDEILCARCGGHLGHVFNDGPKPTGLRYCMNSVAMKFQPDAKQPDAKK